MASDEQDSAPDPLAGLTEAFLARCRRGERPSPEEYATAHPSLAERIRALFPALLLLGRRRHASSSASSCGAP